MFAGSTTISIGGGGDDDDHDDVEGDDDDGDDNEHDDDDDDNADDGDANDDDDDDGDDDDDNENDVGDFVSQRTKSPYLMRVGRARFVFLFAPPRGSNIKRHQYMHRVLPNGGVGALHLDARCAKDIDIQHICPAIPLDTRYLRIAQHVDTNLIAALPMAKAIANLVRPRSRHHHHDVSA